MGGDTAEQIVECLRSGVGLPGRRCSRTSSLVVALDRRSALASHVEEMEEIRAGQGGEGPAPDGTSRA